MLLSAERPFVGASAFHIPGATLRHCSGLVPAVPPASTEHGKRTWGFPRNLGRPTVSASITTGSGGLTRTPLAPSRRRACVERRTQAHGVVTVLRRQRSGTARTAGNRSAP